MIAPYPNQGRPLLCVSASLYEVDYGDADWFQVYWLDESTGEWKFFDSFLPPGNNTLHTLEPDEYYYVVVSAPCQLVIPQTGGFSMSSSEATDTTQTASAMGVDSESDGIWNCHIGYCKLISPYPKNGRSFLSRSVDVSDLSCDADWFQVYWLDESTGEWLYYFSDSASGNTLKTLEPDEYYTVIVSGPCELEMRIS